MTPILTVSLILILPRLLPGEFTGAHTDRVYVGAGSQQVMTVWVPLGKVTPEQGASGQGQCAGHVLSWSIQAETSDTMLRMLMLVMRLWVAPMCCLKCFTSTPYSSTLL